jgi:putative membrane protein
MIGGLALLIAAANVRQPFPNVAPLHHIPTLALLVASPFLLRRWPLSTGSVACLAAFLALHTIGGRYTYTNLPYDLWLEALTGQSVAPSRNMYDRFVHVAFGLLAVPPGYEMLRRHGRLAAGLALAGAVGLVVVLGAFYEMFEWVLTLVIAGPLAEDYNGQQGDAWDAQKDMVLALIGALAAALFVRIRAYPTNSEAGSTGRPGAG